MDVMSRLEQQASDIMKTMYDSINNDNFDSVSGDTDRVSGAADNDYDANDYDKDKHEHVMPYDKDTEDVPYDSDNDVPYDSDNHVHYDSDNESTPDCKVQPRHALLGYPFHNMAAHTEAMLLLERVYKPMRTSH